MDTDKQKNELNEEQKRAVRTTEGAVLIIAGPGTGKTKTLVERVCHLILNCEADPDTITVTTFTKKAAQELYSRISEMLRRKGYHADTLDVHVGNFHQMAGEILDLFFEQTPYLPGYRILSEVEQIALLKEHIDEFSGMPGFSRFFPGFSKALKGIRAFAQFLEQLREGFADFSDASEPMQEARHLLEAYQELLVRENALDYSELLWQAREILKNHKPARECFQKRAQYLMVDEYQDTNPIQEDIIRILQEATGNLCVVGDDDQSLYRFRGASIQNLLGFSRRYPGVTTIYLMTNYRSRPAILSLASEYLDKEFAKYPGKYRFSKNLRSFREEGIHSVSIIEASHENEWSGRVADTIEALHRQGVPFHDIAVLSRSVRGARMLDLVTELHSRGIETVSSRSGSLLAQNEIKRFIGCWTMCFTPIIKEWLHLLPQEETQNARAILHRYAAFYSQVPRKDAEVRVLIKNQMLRRLHQGKQISLLALSYLFLGCAPFRGIAEGALEDDMRAKERMEHLGTFFNLIQNALQKKGFSSIDRENVFEFLHYLFLEYLPFLEEMQLALSEEELMPAHDGRLPVLTIHQAKGLEFPVVIVCDSPSWKRTYRPRPQGIALLKPAPALGKAPEPQIAESLDQARVWYTAFTRARDQLILTHWGAENSSLAEILQYIRQKLPITDPRLQQEKAECILAHPLEKPVRRYSYTTDIALYESCPRAYLFRRRLGLPSISGKQAEYGTLVHESIRMLHRVRGKKNPPESCVLVDEVSQGFTPMGIRFSNEEKKRAAQELDRYRTEHKDLLDRVLISEKELFLSEKNRIFEGRADVLYRTGREGLMGIVDFKTHRPPEKGERVYLDQLRFYRLLLNPEYLETSEQILYYTSEEQPVQRLTISGRDMENFRKKVDAIVSRIENEDFQQMAEDPFLCRLCPMKSFCHGIFGASEMK